VNAAKRYEIFRRLHEDDPEPKTELAYSSPFELLIAVTLSAQATDVSVNKATAKLFPVANTPEAIYALGVEGLSEYIKTIGLYNSKAKNVIETCRLLIERFMARATCAPPVLRDGELEAAGWFTREDLRAGAVLLPPSEAISRQLIDAWLNENG
jgi:endonuclease III